MPTTNPRINVTLSPSLDAIVSRFAAVQGSSKAQVLRELLEAAGPALQRAVLLMEAASNAPREVLGGLARSMEKAQTDVEATLSGGLAMMDSATRDLVQQAEAVQGRRSAGGVSQRRAGARATVREGAKAAAAEGSTPVPVTRGSGTGKTLGRGRRRG